MKVNLREIIHYIDESTLEKAKNEKVQKQESPSNLIWIIFFGWEMALGNLIVGCIWCITIVGIPFGKQFFKMARLSFMPFGASVIG